MSNTTACRGVGLGLGVPAAKTTLCTTARTTACRNADSISRRGFGCIEFGVLMLMIEYRTGYRVEDV